MPPAIGVFRCERSRMDNCPDAMERSDISRIEQGRGLSCIRGARSQLLVAAVIIATALLSACGGDSPLDSGRDSQGDVGEASPVDDQDQLASSQSAADIAETAKRDANGAERTSTRDNSVGAEADREDASRGSGTVRSPDPGTGSALEIVVRGRTGIYAGPQFDWGLRKEVAAGERLVVLARLERNDAWVFVATSDGVVGWAPVDALELSIDELASARGLEGPGYGNLTVRLETGDAALRRGPSFEHTPFDAVRLDELPLELLGRSPDGAWLAVRHEDPDGALPPPARGMAPASGVAWLPIDSNVAGLEVPDWLGAGITPDELPVFTSGLWLWSPTHAGDFTLIAALIPDAFDWLNDGTKIIFGQHDANEATVGLYGLLDGQTQTLYTGGSEFLLAPSENLLVVREAALGPLGSPPLEALDVTLINLDGTVLVAATQEISCFPRFPIAPLDGAWAPDSSLFILRDPCAESDQPAFRILDPSGGVIKTLDRHELPDWALAPQEVLHTLDIVWTEDRSRFVLILWQVADGLVRTLLIAHESDGTVLGRVGVGTQCGIDIRWSPRGESLAMTGFEDCD